jgi:hypothetical protein
MAVNPTHLRIVVPGQSIVDTEDTVWLKNWTATTIGNPNNLETVQNSPMKGALFRNRYDYLIEHLDLEDDFYANDIVVVGMKNTETEFPSFYPPSQLIPWGNYAGMLLRTLIIDKPYNPVPGVLPPYGVNYYLNSTAITPEFYNYQYQLITDEILYKVNEGLNPDVEICPLYIDYSGHDEWRIYTLSYNNTSNGNFDDIPSGTDSGDEDDTPSDRWGHSIFTPYWTLSQSGTIVDGRLIGVPYYATAPTISSSTIPLTAPQAIAGGWILMTGSATNWHYWSDLSDWNPGQRLFNRFNTSYLFICD